MLSAKLPEKRKECANNPWGLNNDKWNLWTCCSCFRKRQVAPAKLALKRDSTVLSVKILAEKEGVVQ